MWVRAIFIRVNDKKLKLGFPTILGKLYKSFDFEAVLLDI